MAKQMAFYFNNAACTACKACMAACKDRSNLPVGINWRRVYDYGGGSWVQDANNKELMVPNNVFNYALSISCNHCQDPKCVEGCPTGGMYKRESDGLVLVDAESCVGCRYCEWLCPYDAPQFNEELGVMTKCDGCQDLVARGEKPACVTACVMRALDFGELEELRVKYGNAGAIAPLPPDEFTRPALVITPHRHAQPSGEGTGRIFTVEEV